MDSPDFPVDFDDHGTAGELRAPIFDFFMKNYILNGFYAREAGIDHDDWMLTETEIDHSRSIV